MTSENRHLVRHSEKPIDKVFYTGSHFTAYCAVSENALYRGDSDAETRFDSNVSQIRKLACQDSKLMLAVGLNATGEIHILESESLTRQLRIKHSSLLNFEDFLIIDSDE